MSEVIYLTAHEYEELRFPENFDGKTILKQVRSEMFNQSSVACHDNEQSFSEEDDLRTLNETDKMNAAKRLGITLKGGSIVARHYVGQVWGPEIDEYRTRSALIVLPKKPSNTKDCFVDPFQMAQTCYRHSAIADRMKSCFFFWPEEKPMRSHFHRDSVRFFVVAFFLNSLAELCKRHLRNEFIRVQNNLVSTVKGKILIHQNLRVNSNRGRIDRVFCQYQKHSLDNRENQILRAALEQCLKEIRWNNSMYKGTKVHEWSTQCDRSLTGVTLRRIDMTEFQSIQLGGLKKVYKKPLHLARWILSLFGNDPYKIPDENTKNQTIFPFAIAMNELFERYCEALMRSNEHFEVIFSGDRNIGLGGGMTLVRPDFIVKSGDEYMVVDAKYKYDWKGDKKYRNDIFQVVSYTRHDSVKDQCLGNYPGKCIIMVPKTLPDFKMEQCSSESSDKRCVNVSELQGTCINTDNNFKTDYSNPCMQLQYVRVPVRHT